MTKWLIRTQKNYNLCNCSLRNHLQDDLTLCVVRKAVALEDLAVVKVLETGDVDLLGPFGQIFLHHLDVRGCWSLLAANVGQLVERELAQYEEEQLRVVLLVG